MKTILYNGIIIVDDKVSYPNGAVVIEDGKISKLIEHFNQIQDDTITWIDAQGNYIIPGMIDIHIHGALSQDFDVCDESGFHQIQQYLVTQGCTSFLASLTPMNPADTLSRLHSISTFEDVIDGATCIGIHMEGPYLSHAYKAVMIEANLRKPDIQELKAMIQASNHRIKVMTVAPELETMGAFIEAATKLQIQCMIGHSAASSSQARQALTHGAVGFTHLYNAMSQHEHRNPGVVTAAFIDKQAYVELIVDGLHVAEDVVLMTHLNHKDTIVLISDAMLATGMLDGEYHFSGNVCVKEGSSVVVKATGRKAGSAVTLQQVIQTMQQITNCSIHDIVLMACINPAKVAQVDKHKGTLTVGKDADLCILNKQLENIMTIVGGQIVYEKN